MSEMWTEPTDEGYADTAGLDDVTVAPVDDYAATDMYAADPMVAEMPAEPWVQPVSCCDCATPGWEQDFADQIAAAPTTPVTSVVVTSAPATEFTDWAQVQADPQAAVVSVGQPLSTVDTQDWTLTDGAGTAVDPATVYPSSVTVGGQTVQSEFTYVPQTGGSPALGEMSIGGQVAGISGSPAPTMGFVGGNDAGYGTLTILDAQGGVVDANSFLPGLSVISSPPAAALASFGASPLAALNNLVGPTAPSADSWSLIALLNTIANQKLSVEHNLL